MKTAELSGAALDWAVSKCEGFTWEQGDLDAGEYGPDFKPSTDWAKGGEIIEREGICLWSEGYDWEAKIQTGVGEWLVEWHESLLTAAMRVYVASKLGDDIEIPKELI
jgi:hypothetical protein